MKKILLKTMLLFIISMLSFLSAWSQIMPPEQYFAEVYPTNPSATDSVYVAYVYVSNDGCPDYSLAKDSVVENRIYVSKKRLPDLGMMCTQVISKFRTILNLGTVSENTEIYFDGRLIKTIYAGCTMDRMGVVTETNNTSSIVKDNTTGDVFEIRDIFLAKGTTVKFKGIKIQCITTPCYNIVECYRIIETPPVGCIINKKGVVVSCNGQLLIQEYSPISSARQLYSIKIVENNTIPGVNPDSAYLDNSFRIDLKEGDEVIFGGYYVKNDSITTNSCRIIGVATCYELINVTPPVGCIMNKKGIAVICNGQLLIQEYSPISSARQLYSIKIGENNITPGVNADGSTSNYPTMYGLKEGDEVIFGGYYVKNDSITTNSCRIVGIATCYELINVIPPVGCIINKEGVVVPGIDGCTGQLFIKETSPQYSYPRLYKIENNDAIYANGLAFPSLKAGDMVRFGGYELTKDSTMSILCPIAGVATCYELITVKETFSLAGKAMAGNELMKSGSAVLFNKNFRKALISYPITDGSFVFAGLPQAEYTVYVIPEINMYKNYLPTFYINKIFFKTADYITLNDNIEYLTVELKNYKMPVGTGKIYGNIFFETIALKDTVMAENGIRKMNAEVATNIAVNIPVLLLNSANEAVAWTMTDAYGNYAFENIALDNYKVVSETAAAIAEYPVSLNSANTTVNADLMLKSELESTDIPDHENNLLALYPNPIVDNLTVELINGTEINIFNAMGQSLMQKQLNAGINVLNLSTLNKGFFFAKIGGKTIKLIKE